MSIAQFMTFLIMPVGCLLIALLFSWIDQRQRRRERERDLPR
jgi:preprotein translocase subunit YajC